MAENKKSFILYCDQKGVWDKLDDAQAGRLVKHIIAYVNDENPVAPDFVTELAFEPIKQSLKRDLRKWEKQQEQRVEAGKRSAEIRQRNATKANDRSTTVNERSISSTVNGSVNGSVSVNDNEINTLSLESDFDLFFKAYDKQEGRVPCQREWGEIDTREYPKILLHVGKYVAATPDKKFRKLPINYLKDRTWLDAELPTQKETTSKQQASNSVYLIDKDGSKRLRSAL
jgi:hypothetical protein